MDEVNAVEGEVVVLRTMLANPTFHPAQLEEQLDRTANTVRSMLLKRGQRGIWGKLFGFDPATLALILQVVLLLAEVIRQLRRAPRLTNLGSGQDGLGNADHSQPPVG